jgi:hypothetical protein
MNDHEQVQAQQEIFVAELARQGIFGLAAKAAGVSRLVAQEWLANDAAFAARHDQALAENAATILRIAQERGLVDARGKPTAKGRRIERRLWRSTHPGEDS